MPPRRATPRFLFRINELREHPNIVPGTDASGNWVPSITRGYNYVVQEGVTNLWWLCDGERIRDQPVPQERLPPGMVPYKTFSMFYSDGGSFWILRGDATNLEFDEPWFRLCFEHDDADGFSSFLTNAREQPALRCRRLNQTWVRMLLPDVHHGSAIVDAEQYGGLKGELPILLGLLAFSMPKESLQQFLPRIFMNGAWQQYDMANGRTHKRGVIVNVYAHPTSNGQTTAQALDDLENGRNGMKYYY
ncbi:hypothetical protein OPT61_g8518 [Boeremia exigua]|uniref:Uncharacterized protein n=1 Tax=Boeremia exigua TaxID=749465 RepID=A0ACC2HYH0_9PLEO|nr:hypothetical protein OPT61_g8518 [Boeremia exigua]